MEREAAGPSPFDAAAADYDAGFTDTLLGRWLREAVRQQVGALFAPGDRVLELGCGTGEDAVWLAQRGVRVTATDAAEAMLDVGRAKAVAARVDDRIEWCRLDLNRVGPWMANSAFDGVLANFGVLNCVPDRRPLAQALARGVRPHGHAALVVMGPVCPWEIAWHLLHGRPRTALRRFHGGIPAHAGGGAYLAVWYPSPRTVQREFAPAFRPVIAMGSGVLLPPTYLRHLVESRPALFRRLAGWERRLGTRFPWTWLNDHYLLVLERRGDPDE